MNERIILDVDYGNGRAWSVLKNSDKNQYFRVNRWSKTRDVEIKQYTFAGDRVVIFCKRLTEV